MSEATSGLQSLAAMAHLLARKHELDNILETAAEQACEALGAATVSISQVTPARDAVRTIVNVGDLGEGEARWPDDETYAIDTYGRLSSAIRERLSWIDCVDDPDCPEEERELLTRLGKHCSMVTAIVVDGQSWGEFYATRYKSSPMFDQDAVAYAEVLAAILAAAVSRLIRETDLHRMAYHDPLTGLLNRRALDDHAADAFELGDETTREIAVVAIDINGLKTINDTEGHARGDHVIRTVAAVLLDAFETTESSVVARIGGDEFTVMVSGGDVSTIEETVNRVCREIAGSPSCVGLSAGIARVVLTPASNVAVTEVFAAADRAQYVAKRTGSSVAVRAEGLSG